MLQPEYPNNRKKFLVNQVIQNIVFEQPLVYGIHMRYCVHAKKLQNQYLLTRLRLYIFYLKKPDQTQR